MFKKSYKNDPEHGKQLLQRKILKINCDWLRKEHRRLKSAIGKMEQEFEINSKQLKDGSFLNNSFTSHVLCN